MNGMQRADRVHEESAAYVPVICPRCKRGNSPHAKYCNGCGLAFDLSYAVDLDVRKQDIKEKIDRLSAEFAKSPEVLDRPMEALELLRKENKDM